MKRSIFLSIFLTVLSMVCKSQNPAVNIAELTDHDLQTAYIGKKGQNRLLFDGYTETPVLSYKIYSSGENPIHDPESWLLKGSNDGKKWVIVDQRKNQKFSSRYQEILCVIDRPATYSQYMLEITAAGKNTLKMAEVLFSDRNMLANWEDFKYPKVKFEILDPQTEGSKIYGQLVQNPDEYVKYHTRKVAEILFFTADDLMNDVQGIDYTLKDYDGISAKSGNPPVVSIVYSTRHIENSAKQSLYKLDYETRGVLYHELVHAYQFEPKGIGTYSTNKEFWACIEGLADAVRSEAGLFDINKLRKPGGNWLDGYKTTGFFLQWLTTKDKDAIRKFHLTVRDLDVWSFDKAIKTIFGTDTSIEAMWNEYQYFLKNSN